MGDQFLVFRNGQKMPIVGLGTWQATDPAELETALELSLEAGYRHIDTAYLYTNEVSIGSILKKWFDQGKMKREDLFITTKLPLQANQPNLVEKFLLKSLQNLQLKYVDLYLIHVPVAVENTNGPGYPFDDKGFLKTIPVNHIDVWKKMEEQVRKGRVKNIGLSNFNKKQIERIMNNSTIKPSCLQIENHVYLQSTELVDYCHRNGIVVVAYSPLGTPHFPKYLEKNNFPTVTKDQVLEDNTVKRIAKKHSKTPAQVLLKFLVQRNISVIPKSTNEKRIKENIDIFDFQLDEADMKELKQLDRGEDGRIITFKHMKGIEKHDEYPF